METSPSSWNDDAVRSYLLSKCDPLSRWWSSEDAIRYGISFHNTEAIIVEPDDWEERRIRVIRFLTDIGARQLTLPPDIKVSGAAR